MDPTGIRSSPFNIRVTAVEDATQGGGGGITYLDYSRVHVVRPGQGHAHAHARSTLTGAGTVVPVEDVVATGGDPRARHVAQQAAEVCRSARQICVQNGNAGAERAARDAIALIDQITTTTFQKS